MAHRGIQEVDNADNPAADSEDNLNRFLVWHWTVAMGTVEEKTKLFDDILGCKNQESKKTHPKIGVERKTNLSRQFDGENSTPGGGI